MRFNDKIKIGVYILAVLATSFEPSALQKCCYIISPSFRTILAQMASMIKAFLSFILWSIIYFRTFKHQQQFNVRTKTFGNMHLLCNVHHYFTLSSCTALWAFGQRASTRIVFKFLLPFTTIATSFKFVLYTSREPYTTILFAFSWELVGMLLLEWLSTSI